MPVENSIIIFKGKQMSKVSENINRANYIAGHVKAVARMLEGDAYCIDVIHQLDAVSAAVTKLRQKVLDRHLNTCVIDAIRGSDGKKREKAISELLTVYERS